MDKILKTNLWVEKYKKLIQYIKNNNGKYPKSENSLSIWINTQRQNYKKGILLKEREEKLNEIGFIWEIDLEEKWNENFIQLKEYLINNNGEYPKKEDKILYNWIGHQKQDYKKGKISKERIEKLNEINFIWEIYLEEQWNENFNQLKEYLINNNGKYPKFDNSLGSWVSTQRTNYKKNILSKERIEKLEEIGFLWGERKERVDWDLQLDKLKEYLINNNGEYPKQQGNSLGSWVNNQRTNYKKGILSKDRIEKLDEIGFLWSVRE